MIMFILCLYNVYTMFIQYRLTLSPRPTNRAIIFAQNNRNSEGCPHPPLLRIVLFYHANTTTTARHVHLDED